MSSVKIPDSCKLEALSNDNTYVRRNSRDLLRSEKNVTSNQILFCAEMKNVDQGGGNETVFVKKGDVFVQRIDREWFFHVEYPEKQLCGVCLFCHGVIQVGG